MVGQEAFEMFKNFDYNKMDLQQEALADTSSEEEDDQTTEKVIENAKNLVESLKRQDKRVCEVISLAKRVLLQRKMENELRETIKNLNLSSITKKGTRGDLIKRMKGEHKLLLEKRAEHSEICETYNEHVDTFNYISKQAYDQNIRVNRIYKDEKVSRQRYLGRLRNEVDRLKQTQCSILCNFHNSMHDYENFLKKEERKLHQVQQQNQQMAELLDISDSLLGDAAGIESGEAQ